MMISVVMCSVDEGRFAGAARMYQKLLRGVESEVVRVSDARGLAEGYNVGLGRSRGKYVVFSHDDVEFLADDFGGRLLGHMRGCDVLGVVGTRRLCGPEWVSAGPPYLYGQIAAPRAADGNYVVNYWSVPTRRVDHIQALDGVFLCVRRGVAEAVTFDQATFDGFHLYDIDFSYRAFRAGFRVSVGCDLVPLHRSYGDFGREWGRYAKAFMAKVGELPVPHPATTGAAIVVSGKEQVVGAMRQPHWEDG